jgi:hypothetical protein
LDETWARRILAVEEIADDRDAIQGNIQEELALEKELEELQKECRRLEEERRRRLALLKGEPPEGELEK